MVHLTSAVVIPTFNRAERIRGCLGHLAAQSIGPDRIVVVDSSADNLTETVVREFEGVVYVRNPQGRGHTSESRQIGFSLTREDIVAFLDDDADAHPDWLEQLLKRYLDPSIGGVGGSALNGVEGERQSGIGSIGLLLPDGRLTGNFAGDPGRDVEVDHLLGANMSFRRSAIVAVGGIYGDYPGTCLREESDLALRVRRAGYRLIYSPEAVVDHRPGEYAKGRRFDLRYMFYANRNSVVLLSRVYGMRSPYVRRFVWSATREVFTQGRRAAGGLRRVRKLGVPRALRIIVGGASRAGTIEAGVIVGFPAAVRAIRADRVRQRAIRVGEA